MCMQSLSHVTSCSLQTCVISHRRQTEALELHVEEALVCTVFAMACTVHAAVCVLVEAAVGRYIDCGGVLRIDSQRLVF